MAAKKNRSPAVARTAKRRPSRQKRGKPQASPRDQALSFLRSRIRQYEVDIGLLRALEAQLAGTAGPATVSAKILRGARAAGWSV